MILISELPEGDAKILKTIHKRGTAKVGDLVQIFGEPYTVQDLSTYLSWLEKRHLLERTQNDPPTYKVSGPGLIALGLLPKEANSVFLSVPSEKCFRFYTGMGSDKFTGTLVCSLSDLYEKLKTIDVRALEFHVPRGDVEKWVRDVLLDDDLGQRICQVKQQNLRGNQLRNQMLSVINLRIRELTTVKSE